MLSPECLAASITAVAVAIADGKNSDEVGLLSIVFTQLGDTLATISAARTLYGNSENNSSQNATANSPQQNTV